MGTRADFYIGRGEQAEWLGSIGWDGYPDGIDELLLHATSEAAFRVALEAFFKDRDDVTRPADGWPWPWADSCTTDYAYAFDGENVWGSCFGNEWFDTREPQPERDGNKTAVFPDMKARQNVTLGKRSGTIVISG